MSIEGKLYTTTKIVRATRLPIEEIARRLKRPMDVSSPIQHTEGYLVEYQHGYKSWCPVAEFESQAFEIPAYYDLEDPCFGFGTAIEFAKQGKKVARVGWEEKNIMYMVYQKGFPKGIPANENTAKIHGLKEGDTFYLAPYLQIMGRYGVAEMYIPSQDDMLSFDWRVVENV